MEPGVYFHDDDDFKRPSMLGRKLSSIAKW